MAGQSRPIPQAEAQRKLPSTAIATTSSAQLSINIPVDTVIRDMMVRFSGTITPTFASGTPVADFMSTMDNLFPTMVLQVDGRLVKSVSPHMMHMQQIMASTVQGERACASNSSSVYPLTDGGFAYGTTTQVSAVREAILISFKHLFCEFGANATCLDTRGRSNVNLTIYQNAFTALLGFGNTCPASYATTSNVDVILNEWKDVPKAQEFLDWKQTYRDESISAQVTSKQFQINVGAKLSALQFLARDGAAGSTTTATGKVASDTLVTNMSFLVNGDQLLKQTDWGILKADNKARFGVSSALASSLSRTDGYALWNFINRKDIRTALDLSRNAGVNSAVLQIDSGTSSNVSYTNAATLRIQTDEIVRP